VICAELARISSHLLGVGCYAMDVGAMTVFLHTFTEREKIYNLCESLTGARFTTSYTRIGGLSRDLPAGWVDACRKFVNEVVENIDETETLLTRNRIFVDRTQGVGTISREDAIDYGLTGPNLRGSGVEYDLRKDQPYLVIDLVVSAVLMALGMMMLPPVVVSLPFKILLFCLVDGWVLLMQALVTSYR
jgi:NADH-quinone oxidoreductase subunit D